MLGAAVDWANLTVATAFVLGAVLASVAVLRVVRAVTAVFVDVEHRRGVPRDGESPPPPVDGGHTNT